MKNNQRVKQRANIRFISTDPSDVNLFGVWNDQLEKHAFPREI